MTKPETSQRQVLIFLCHRTEPEFIARFKAIESAFKPQGDAFFVFDNSDTELPPSIKALRHATFTKTSLNALGYPRLHDGFYPGHTHFPMLDFAIKHPSYSYYWVVEYDVRLTCPWGIFFWLLRHSHADFIATHLRRFQEQQAWYWWPSFSHPEESVDLKTCIRFFGPISRMSREAVQLVDSKLKSGWKGHQEVVIPTLIAAAGLQLQDLASGSYFGCHTKWSWYTYQKADRAGYLAKSSMRFLPPMESLGLRPFTLYHPIKLEKSGYQLLLDRVRRKILSFASKMSRSSDPN